MVITHALLGGLLGAAATVLGLPGPLVAAGLIGGTLPDIDAPVLTAGIFTHRRSLHAPMLYTAAVIPTLAVTLVLPAAAPLAVFLLAAGLHSATDALGGGLEPRPWERTDDRGVYCHATQRWWRARRVVYDGSPGDVAAATLTGTVLYLAAPWTVVLVGPALVVAGLYGLLRRRLGWWFPAEWDGFTDFFARFHANVRADRRGELPR